MADWLADVHLPVTRQALAAGPHELAQIGCSARWLASASHASQQPLHLYYPGRLAFVLPAAGVVVALQLTVHTSVKVQSTGQLTNGYHNPTRYQADNIKSILLTCVACCLLSQSCEAHMMRQLDLAITCMTLTNQA